MKDTRARDPRRRHDSNTAGADSPHYPRGEGLHGTRRPVLDADNSGSNNTNAAGAARRGGRLGYVKALLRGDAFGRLPHGRRRLLRVVVSVLLLGILFCLLALLQLLIQANENDAGLWQQEQQQEQPMLGGGANQDGTGGAYTAKQAGAFAAPHSPLKDDEDQQLEADARKKTNALAGDRPEFAALPTLTEDQMHGQKEKQQEAEQKAEGAIRPLYVDMVQRQHPYLTVKQLELMATAAASTDANDALPSLTAVLSKGSREASVGAETHVDVLVDPVSGAELLFSRTALTHADRDLEDVAHYLLPPHQRAAVLRETLNTLLAFGSRAVGDPAAYAAREGVLQYVTTEGLGRRRILFIDDADTAAASTTAARYVHAPHLNAKGRELLLKHVHTREARRRRGDDSGFHVDKEGAASLQARQRKREGGWWWSLHWDNFTVTAPLRLKSGSTQAHMVNAVFRFAGGTRFRRKQADYARRAASGSARGNGHAGVFNAEKDNGKEALEARGADRYRGPEYQQESFVRLAGGAARGMSKQNVMLSRPFVETTDPTPLQYLRKPGDKVNANSKRYANGKYYGNKRVVLTYSKQSVPLKASYSALHAAPVTDQPLTHLVFAAHWDTMPEEGLRGAWKAGRGPFVGACDSAVPMVYLLRKIKNIAALSDIAEAVTALYKEERAAAGNGETEKAPGAIPGVNALFQEQDHADVERHLSQVLSPAQHALFYHYFFAPRPASNGFGGSGDKTGDRGAYTDARSRSLLWFTQPPLRDAQRANATFAYHESRAIDVRALLDWVQHLPEIEVMFFDGEEALKSWEGDDNTYGSRHLAQQYATTAATATIPLAPFTSPEAGDAVSRMDQIDLFALYDLMGPTSTQLHNFYPTQSGIYFAELSRLEMMKRKRAHAHSQVLALAYLDAAAGMSKSGTETERTCSSHCLRVLTRVLGGVARSPTALTSALSRLLSASTLNTMVRPVSQARNEDLLGLIVDEDCALEGLTTEDAIALASRTASPLQAGHEKVGGAADGVTKPMGEQHTSSTRHQTARARYSQPYDVFALYRELYAALPPAWTVFGSPHDMFTLHGLPRQNDPQMLAALTANPHLRAHALVRGMEQDDAVPSTPLKVFRTLFHLNRNVFFPVGESPLTGRQAFRITVDDDHRHWLDSQRVLHLIPTPFPPAWHTMNDDGASIDDGTMTDLWSILWDFTLMLGEYWETA